MHAVTVIRSAPGSLPRWARELRTGGLLVHEGSLRADGTVVGPIVAACSPGDLARLRGFWPSVPILAVVQSPEEGARALEAGADDFARPAAGEILVRLARLAPRPPIPQEPRKREKRRARPKILVVEDDAPSREALVELLSPRYDAIEAGDATQGLRLAREEQPDLLLLDLYLPGIDGLTALERLRASPATSEIPVLVLSAAGDVATKVRGLDLGAVDYLTKPLSGPELLARVERTLRITAQREHYRALAQTDALTGLPNYGAFRARLADEVERARRYGVELSAVMMDLDNLKEINDQHGHSAGNRALCAAADVLRSELRGSDFAARYGGDEFVVLLPHTGAAHARRFAERVRAAISRARPDGLSLTASFGVASLAGAADAEALVRAADGALYEAKHAGKDRTVLAHDALVQEHTGARAR